MKKIFFLLVVISLFNVYTFSQSGWILQDSGTNQDLWAIYFLDQNKGWAAGREGTLLQTTNGGATWDSVTTNTTAWFRSIFFLDQNFGWVVGPYYTVTNSSGCLLKTTNGGGNWILQTFQDPFFEIIFIDQNIGWAMGFNGEIYPNYYGIIWKTTDGGETWIQKATAPAPSSFRDMQFINESTGWVVGGHSPNGPGIILKTTDAGETWIEYSNPFNKIIENICFVDNQYGWIFGPQLITHTTNGGEDWFIQYSGTNALGQNLYFINQNEGWIIGSWGRIKKSTDEGLNWFAQISPVEHTLYSIFFLDNSEGWIVGQYGIILHTTDGGGVTFIDDGIEGPNEYSISQNYPNPFNPSTAITYQIPQREIVSLKVYDILGKEVATLVNEEKPAGSYEVQFDGTGLTSGIYFYQLSVGNYTETKKMILLR